ncbi:sensor histidine kinase [Humidisolicoccus flavus]|uniref:sensor histidine kinase n=1 Tax=Humidisolicoccus flavus TaxID=3111414 RepID=UPI00324520F7
MSRTTLVDAFRRRAGTSSRDAWRFVRRMSGVSLLIDLAIALVCGVIFIAPWPFDILPPSATAVVISVVAIFLRRLSPTTALALLWVLASVQILGGERPGLLDASLLIVIGTISTVGSRLEVVLAGLSAIAGGFIATWYLATTGTRYLEIIDGAPDERLGIALLPTFALSGAWFFGVALRSLRARTVELQRRVAAEDVAERAVDEVRTERIRTAMARDVHDVVGHSLAVIIAQADSVRYLRDEAQIRAVSETIANTARSSLTEVRAVLSESITPAENEPAALESIVERVRAAGVTVDRSMRGTPRVMDANAAVVARRVLQEMLANALHHGAENEPIMVRELWRSEDLVLEVENVIAKHVVHGSGLGLSGMQARVASINGSFEATRIGDSFSARARIPTAALLPPAVQTRHDTGRIDTGRIDTGRSDTGRSDTGRIDTGRVDAARSDKARVANDRGTTERSAAGRREASKVPHQSPAPPRTHIEERHNEQ